MFGYSISHAWINNVTFIQPVSWNNKKFMLEITTCKVIIENKTARISIFACRNVALVERFFLKINDSWCMIKIVCWLLLVNNSHLLVAVCLWYQYTRVNLFIEVMRIWTYHHKYVIAGNGHIFCVKSRGLTRRSTGDPTRAWWRVQPRLLTQKRGQFPLSYYNLGRSNQTM